MPPEARRAKLEGLGRHQGAEGNKMWPEGGIFPMARGHGCDIDIIILAGRYYITGAILDLSSQYAGLYYRPGRILTTEIQYALLQYGFIMENMLLSFY